MRGAALLLVLGCTGAAAIDAGPGRWKVDVKLSLVEKDGKWSFRIDGTTDLPAGTVLNARVFVLDVVDDPIQGRIEDDTEALVGADDPFQSAAHAFRIDGAEFHEAVHSFKRKPYSISYRVKVTYSPDDQSDALALKVGDESFSHRADLRVGTEADLATELRERVRDLGRDLVTLEKLSTELDGWIGRAAKDPAAWQAWKEPAAETIDSLELKNLHRFNVWAVWAEYQGRMRIGGLSGLLQRIIQGLDEPAPDEKKLRRWMTGFVDSIDEAYTVIGFDPPLDERKAGPVLAAYEQAVKPILEGKADQLRAARSDGISALFDLLRLLRSRPRGYTYVNEVGFNLSQVWTLVNDKAPAPEVNQALARHDAALRQLRKFAGLP